MSLDFTHRKLLDGAILLSFIAALMLCAFTGISFFWLALLIPLDIWLFRLFNKKWGRPKDETTTASGEPICYCPMRDEHKHPPA